MTGTDKDRVAWATWERNFIQNMQSLRRAKAMNQTDLARKLKALGLPFHQQTIQRIEAGDRPVRLDEAHLIAGVFDVSLDTMTSLPVGEHTDIVRAADWVARRSARVLEEIRESLGDWSDDYEILASEVLQALERDRDRLSPEAIWGLTVMFRVDTAFAEIWATCEALASVSGTPLDEWRLEARADVAEWRRKYASVAPPEAFDLDAPLPPFPGEGIDRG